MKKRSFGGSEGDTPGKPNIKQTKSESKPARKSLFGKDDNSLDSSKDTGGRKWEDKEIAALIQYIGLYYDESFTNGWPTFKNPKFWSSCAVGVAETSGCPVRSGPSCRSKVLKHLKKKFTLSEAEEVYNVNYIEKLAFQHSVPDVTQPLSPIFGHSPSVKAATGPHIGDIISDFISAFKQKLTARMKRQLLNYLLKTSVELEYGLSFLHFVKGDMLDVILSGMQKLFINKKDNIVYKLAQILSTETLKLDRMPYGLLDYNIRFLAAKSSVKLEIENHYVYVDWQTTMLAHFGHRWVALSRGPMWQYEQDEAAIDDKNHCKPECIQNLQPPQTTESTASSGHPSDIISEALLMSGIEAKSDIPLSSSSEKCNVQVSEGDDDAEVPNATKSVSHLWTNLTDDDVRELEYGDPSEIEEQHGIVKTAGKIHRQSSNMYKPDKAFVNVAGLSSRQLLKKIQLSGFKREPKIQVSALKRIQSSNPNGRWWIKADAFDVREGLRESMAGKWSGDEDLDDGTLENLRSEYEEREKLTRAIGVRVGKKNLIEDLKITLSLLDKDYSFLKDGLEFARSLLEEKRLKANASEDALIKLSWDVVGYEGLMKDIKSFESRAKLIMSTGESKDLQAFRKDVRRYMKQLYTKKRKAATHIMVFMVADESRNMKPYALPVRVMPYQSIKDSRLRELIDELKNVMTNMSMKVVGVVTDGEFNSIRTMGMKRPISIIQLISNSRAEARSLKASRIEKSLKLNANGTIQEPHPAVPVEDVQWLHVFMQEEGVSFRAALNILRRKLFPFNYDPCNWIQGKTETKADCLKSIMAIYLFRSQIETWKTFGVDFSKNLVVSEIDDITEEEVHQREDHNHLLKRIIACLREGHIPGFELMYLRDALHDPESGLTYEALTGKNKQSVPDCERIISPGVIHFMTRNGHDKEAAFLQLVLNWHKAVDGRGLTEEIRSKYCSDLKQWILKDWIPYLLQVDNYSFIDVNRPIKGVCGLTREVIVGLVANLETREARRHKYLLRGLPPEHPRASSTDDVEGFIALLHEMLGNAFDLKQFYDQFPKIMAEFMKRIDPDLPFFYWTGRNVRFQQFPLPSFNKPSTGGIERLDIVRVSRRGDPGVFVANRASLPQRNKLTVRANFHKAPVALPPVLQPL